MFTLLTGPFHPSLENALVEIVRQFKQADPQVPLSIVVPSELMRRRVQWVLCAEHGLSLFHVSFLTFHQLVLRLQAERALMEGFHQPEESSLELVNDRFYEWMVPWLLDKLDLCLRSEGSLDHSRGMRQAIWRTIRDLQEAQVDPSVGLRAVEEGVFEAFAHDRLLQIFSLQAAVGQWSRHLKVGLPDDLTQSILSWVARSPFLLRQAHVLYYGFYDLTQIQLSLLEEVSRARPVKVFFPLETGPASQFAQRFLERYLLKGSVEHLSLRPDAQEIAHGSVRSAFSSKYVVSAIGEQGELLFACKTILQLVETQGYAFHEIGIVARNLEVYSPIMNRLFQEHRVPFCTTATQPFLDDPWAKLWWNMVGVQQEEFPVQMVMNILTSPYYQSHGKQGRPLSEDAHWWRRLLRQARIIRGRGDWERLAELASDRSNVQELLDARVWPSHLSVKDVRAFAHEVMQLIQTLEACPPEGTVGEITAFFETVFDTYIENPGVSRACQEDADEVLRSGYLRECVQEVMSLLWQWDRLGERITSNLWVERFQELVEAAQIPLPGQSEVGVQVMDAMAARGYGFRALLLLGLNDQVFPRVVREDAFLRDVDRRVLAESLGYKIDEKLTGLDEEALLFALLERSARERLYAIYQRADKQGRPLLPSSFLAQDLREPGGPGETLIHVPLSLIERHRLPNGAPEPFTPPETRILSLLQGRRPSSEIVRHDSWQAIFHNGLYALSMLERSDRPAGSFDGLVEPDHLHWRKLQLRGVSPTSLERFVQCPLRFWMQEILGTRDVREPVTRDLPPRVWGQLGHEVLQAVYERVSKEEWPHREMERTRIQKMIHDLIQERALFYARVYGKGYVILWEEVVRRLGHVIEDMVVLDQEEFVTQGWKPLWYEVEGTGRLPSWSPDAGEDFPIYGRVDRVDQGLSGQGLRVVDYKFSWSRAQTVFEPDFIAEAGQGKRLQAPFYAWLSSFRDGTADHGTAGTLAHVQAVEFRFLRPFQSPSLGAISVSADAWTGEVGKQLGQHLTGWVKALQQGKFFFIAGAHCRDCAWASACRSQHHPSWSRVQSLPLARSFRLIKKQRFPHA